MASKPRKVEYSYKLFTYAQNILVKHHSKKAKITNIEHQITKNNPVESTWIITLWEKKETPCYIYNELTKCSKKELKGFSDFLMNNMYVEFWNSPNYNRIIEFLIDQKCNYDVCNWNMTWLEWANASNLSGEYTITITYRPLGE